MSIPLSIVVSKPNKHKLEIKHYTEIAKNIDDAKSIIIHIFQEYLSKFPILPTDYEEFIYKCWFADISADTEPFQYKIYLDNKWETPWSNDDIYEEVYDILHKVELLNAYVNEANREDNDEDDEILEDNIDRSGIDNPDLLTDTSITEDNYFERIKELLHN
jgi:hypothetical protein